MRISNLLLLGSLCLLATGCMSGRFKERQAERDRVAVSSGMFCEFINGDANPDVDVEMSLQMAKKCDGSKPVSIAPYKTASEIHGMIYCCSTKADMAKGLPAKIGAAAAPAPNKSDAKPAAKPAPGKPGDKAAEPDADIVE